MTAKVRGLACVGCDEFLLRPRAAQRAEQSVASALLEEIGELARRWGVKNGGKPGTIRTYRGRARSLLEDYLKYVADPSSFKGRSKPAGSEQKANKPKGRPKPKAQSEPTPPQEQVSEDVISGQYRLRDGRVVRRSPPTSTLRR